MLDDTLSHRAHRAHRALGFEERERVVSFRQRLCRLRRLPPAAASGQPEGQRDRSGSSRTAIASISTSAPSAARAVTAAVVVAGGCMPTSA